MHFPGEKADTAATSVESTSNQMLAWLLSAARLLALFVLIVYLPVIVAAGLLVVMTSSGPAFVKKAYRRGNGSNSVVYLYEFRTECWKTWNETSVGSFLRRADIHRLPRLANVMLGDVHAGERLQPHSLLNLSQ